MVMMAVARLPLGQPVRPLLRPFGLRIPELGAGSGRARETSRLRILVVEDDFLLALRLEMLLDDAGYDVVGPAARLDQALALIKREAVDAAILDVNLNGTMVFPLADALARQGAPFLFLTAYGDDQVYPEHLRGRPRLSKPQDDNGILRVLRGLLSDA